MFRMLMLLARRRGTRCFCVLVYLEGRKEGGGGVDGWKDGGKEEKKVEGRDTGKDTGRNGRKG